MPYQSYQPYPGYAPPQAAGGNRPLTFLEMLELRRANEKAALLQQQAAAEQQAPMETVPTQVTPTPQSAPMEQAPAPAPGEYSYFKTAQRQPTPEEQRRQQAAAEQERKEKEREQQIQQGVQAGVAGYNTYQAMQGGTTGGTTAAGGGGGYASGVGIAAGQVAGTYGMYDLLSQDNVKPGAGAAQGAASGAAIGSVGGVYGMAIGAVVGGIIGAIKGHTGSGKGDEQRGRDMMRNVLENAPVQGGEGATTNFFFKPEGSKYHHVLLADGSSYNVGRDIGEELVGVDGSEHFAFNIDPNNKMGAQTVGWVMPLAIALGGENSKIVQDLTGYLSNAAMSNAETLEGVRANVLSFMDQLGWDAGELTQQLASILEAGKITQEQYDSMIHSLGVLTGGYSDLYVEMSQNEFEATHNPQIPPSSDVTNQPDLDIVQDQVPDQRNPAQQPDLDIIPNEEPIQKTFRR